MIKQRTILVIASILILSSCTGRYQKIAGYWEANFSDSIHFPKQILLFYSERNNLKLLIDEPSEDMFEMPGENVFIINDSIHYESLWRLFKYNGKIITGDSIIQGARVFNNEYATSFTIKRIRGENITYKIPRINEKGKRVTSYTYCEPLQRNDGIVCSTLSDTNIDSTYIFKLVKDILNGGMNTIHSLLILKDNKLVLEEYFHSYNYNKPHAIQSVTKSITSALVGIGIDKEFIPSVNEPVWRYFENWDYTKWVKEKYSIQIQHLLTMTSGIEWKGFTPNQLSDDVNIYKKPDFIEYVLNKDLKERPGERFLYNNRTMLLLGHIIEKSSGLPVDSFARKYLFNELDIKNYKWKIYDNGITETGGGLTMLPRDMLKFGLLYLNHGKWQDKQIIPPGWVKSSSEDQLHSGKQEYGYNWWIKSYSINYKIFRTYYALGHGEQAIIIIPDANVVFVMTAGNYFNTKQRLDEIMIKYILPSLSDNKINLNSKRSSNLKDLEGEYEINRNEKIKIEINGNSLVAIDPSGVSFKLIPKSGDYYIIENSPREVQFVSDEQGIIVAAEIYINGQRDERLNKIYK